jgi:CheY-like chemotaxis protein
MEMPNVLVAENDLQLRVWMRHLLESKGYHVEEVDDGYEALTLILRGHLAVVVLDLRLPKVNGLEIIIYLKAHSPSLKILAICDNLVRGIDTCHAATAHGAHDALAKPLDAETFLKHVSALLPHPS